MKDKRTIQECETCVEKMLREHMKVFLAEIPTDKAKKLYDEIESTIIRAEKRIKELKSGALSLCNDIGGEVSISG